jgi:hypothetical protein
MQTFFSAVSFRYQYIKFININFFSHLSTHADLFYKIYLLDNTQYIFCFFGWHIMFGELICICLKLSLYNIIF